MKKQKTEKLKTNKGITLIALVITIIVMLILIAVTISIAVNGGLFEYAGKAAEQTQNAIDKEQELANLDANLTVDELIDKFKGEQEQPEEPQEPEEPAVVLPDDFFTYSDTEKTILTGINSAYLVETDTVAKKLEEGIKIASTKPIRVAVGGGLSAYYSIIVNGVEVTDIVIPEGIVEIASKAFDGNVSIANVSFPSTLRTIGDYAFRYCHNLSVVTILPNSVTTIGQEAFSNCLSLSAITIPESVVTIKNYVFFDCNTTVTVPFASSSNKPTERSRN